MALIVWDESFSVGVSRIDEQHKKLVGMINELNEAMRKGQGKEVVGDIVKGLVEYTLTHFALEEKLFAGTGYPDTAAHKREHAEFVAKVSKFRDDFEAGRLSLSIDVMNFLSGWLKGHIKGCDQKYSNHFKEKGLSK